MRHTVTRASLLGARFLALVSAVAVVTGATPRSRATEPLEAGCGTGRASVDSLTGETRCNPIESTEDSIGRGRRHFLRHCQSCHGFDGRGLDKVDFQSADLTHPPGWRFGTSDADVYRTVVFGRSRNMPPFGERLEPRDVWEIVNYLRSIGPLELRPGARPAGVPPMR